MLVDYYFALTSPWSYLGHERFVALARRCGAEVRCKPIKMHEVFAVSGGRPVAERPPQRQAYRLQELRRWREHLGVPLNLQPRHFPVPDAAAARMVIAAAQAGQDPAPLIGAYMRAVWAEERDISDPATVRAIAGEAGHDAARLAGLAEADPAVEAAYEANTREAIERQVFGVPTWIIGEELLWGQDRLDFVERLLQGGQARAG